MRYFQLLDFNSRTPRVSSRLAAHHQEVLLRIYSNWNMPCIISIPILPAASQHNAWLCQLLFIRSWSSWWWAASLLETCRSLLL